MKLFSNITKYFIVSIKMFKTKKVPTRSEFAYPQPAQVAAASVST
jgi:hypothetical protein